MFRASTLLVSGLAVASAFVPAVPSSRPGLALRMASQNVGKVAVGDRLVTDIEGETVMVVNHKGSAYALSPKCPHLGLPMKSGEISDDGPCITCKFHGSKFRLDTGECVEWSEKVMGFSPPKFMSDAIGSVGGEKNSPATVFKSETDEDGNIIVTV